MSEATELRGRHHAVLFEFGSGRHGEAAQQEADRAGGEGCWCSWLTSVVLRVPGVIRAVRVLVGEGVALAPVDGVAVDGKATMSAAVSAMIIPTQKIGLTGGSRTRWPARRRA